MMNGFYFYPKVVYQDISEIRKSGKCIFLFKTLDKEKGKKRRKRRDNYPTLLNPELGNNLDLIA